MKLPFYETWEVFLPVPLARVKKEMERRIRPIPFSGSFIYGFRKSHFYGNISDVGFRLFWHTWYMRTIAPPVFQGSFEPVSSGTLVSISLRPSLLASVVLVSFFVTSVILLISSDAPVYLVFLVLMLVFYIEASKGRKRLAVFFNEMASVAANGEKIEEESVAT